MTARDRLSSTERSVRLLRLAAALAVIVAVIALVAIVRGDLAGKIQALIIVAVALGACALIGMALLTLFYVHGQKDKNDPRS